MIILNKTLLDQLHKHGQEAYPEECCGAMMGECDSKANKKIVTELVRIENNSSENKHRRFAITPQDYMRLEKEAKAKKRDLLGFYHTHPDHPCQPSETDLKFAWPFFSYIILSVKNGEPTECRSFVLDQNTTKFSEEPCHEYGTTPSSE